MIRRTLVTAAALLALAAPAHADCMSGGRGHCRPRHEAAFVVCVESNGQGPNPYQLMSAHARRLGAVGYMRARYGTWTAAERAWRRRCTAGYGWW